MGPSLFTDTSQLIALITAFLRHCSSSLLSTAWELTKVWWLELSLDRIRLSFVFKDQHLSQPMLLWLKFSRFKSPVLSDVPSFRVLQNVCWVTIKTLGPWTSQKWQRATIADMAHSKHAFRPPGGSSSHCWRLHKLLITERWPREDLLKLWQFLPSLLCSDPCVMWCCVSTTLDCLWLLNTFDCDARAGHMTWSHVTHMTSHKTLEGVENCWLQNVQHSWAERGGGAS